MTYQTTPYKPWVFPDEAYHMNLKGMRPLKPTPIENGFDLMPGDGSEAQTRFDDHDRRVALERVKYTKLKNEGMIGQRNTTARSQRYDRPASRSAVPNGVFPGNEYLTSAGLRGGVITTKEGREWLEKRLLQRRTEYAQLASGDFSAGPPKDIDVSPYNTIDTLLQTAFTAITTGTFSGSLNDTLNQLTQSLIRVGATITGRQLTNYAQAIGKMAITARSYSRANLEVAAPELGTGLDTKRYFKLETIQETIKILDATVREIARVLDQPKSAREQVMSTLSSRILGRQVELFRPEAHGHLGTAPPIETGGPPGELFPPPEVEGPAEIQPSYSDISQFDTLAGLGRYRRVRF